MQEIWKDISGFEGFYEISSYGRVRSVKSGKILSTSKCGGCRGYIGVSLCKNGKRYGKLVHRLVAEAFIPAVEGLSEVNHKDEDKTNNRVENLEWCSHKYNMNYGKRNIRSKDTHIKNGYWTGLSKEEYNRKYRECHKEELREYHKEYNSKYRGCHKEELREYRECHKEENRLYAKIYYENNKEKIREQHREYYEKNKEKINEYKEKNKEKIKEYKRAYYYRHREEILKKMKKK